MLTVLDFAVKYKYKLKFFKNELPLYIKKKIILIITFILYMNYE